jgi:hypothetical protein
MPVHAVQNGMFAYVACGPLKLGLQFAQPRSDPRPSAKIIDVACERLDRGVRRAEPIADSTLPARKVVDCNDSIAAPALTEAFPLYRPSHQIAGSASLLRLSTPVGQLISTHA